MASAFIDSLKLVLSDDYEVSDSGYKALSDILLNAGLSDSSAFDTGLVQIISLMIKHNQRFPISLTFLRELWQTQNISFNFVRMLGDLLGKGIISLRKVKRDTFFSNKSITKSSTEELDKDIYVVIYGSKTFNEILSGFEAILTKPAEPIQEGMEILPKKYQDLVSKAAKLLARMDIKISVESFLKDTTTGKASLSVILSQTSKYKLKDKEIQKVASKHIKGSKVQSIESYKESDSELFLGIELSDTESSYQDISNAIFSFAEELEIQGV